MSGRRPHSATETRVRHAESGNPAWYKEAVIYELPTGAARSRAEADDGPISGGADLALTCPAAESTMAVETSLARLRSRIEFRCETVAAALALIAVIVLST